jgi:hypothetical protein
MKRSTASDLRGTAPERRQPKPAFLAEYAGSGSGSGSGSGGGKGEKKIVKGKRSGRNCNASVIAAMNSAWMGAGDGLSNTERAFVLTSGNGSGCSTIVPIGNTNEQSSINFKLPANTCAIYHTHPNSKSPVPSAGDQAVANKYNIPVYTITSSGLYEYQPNSDTITQYGTNQNGWLQACPGGSGSGSGSGNGGN